MAAISTRPRREHIEPLWDRVDRNRLKLAAFVALFVSCSAGGFVAMFAIPWLVLLYYSSATVARTSQEISTQFWGGLAWAAVFVGCAAALWASITLLRSEKWLVKRIGATLVPQGELLDTKFALKDMAIAAGLPVAPALYVMPDSSTNAFVFAARRRRAVIGVTEGFVRKLTVDQQRAVFANLVARLVCGDTIVSTGVTSLMWPVHAWRESRMTADDGHELTDMAEAMQSGDRAEQERSRSAGDVAAYVAFGVGFAVLAELVAAGHRRALLTTAEKADAEGMLLLKDPVTMLAALRRCIELNNVVPAAGEAFAELFYCWTGIATDDEDDPEWVRVSRLKEVLGVMGHEPEVPETLGVAPAAPRVDTTEPGVRLEG